MPQSKGLVNRVKHKNKGFSLPELMVVLGIVVILAGFMLPGLGGARQLARDLGVMSNIRQLGMLVSIYMDDHRAAPAAFPPIRVPDGAEFHEKATPYGRIYGSWFTSGKLYQYLFDERLPNSVVAAPGKPGIDSESYILGSYSISDTFYARPNYWNRRTQRGPEQWAAMRLDHVRYPSSKGFMLQDFTYTMPNFPSGMMTCCAQDVPSAILWSDLSASQEIQGLMPPGVPNFFDERNTATISYWADGAPLRSTADGVYGRDR